METFENDSPSSNRDRPLWNDNPDELSGWMHKLHTYLIKGGACTLWYEIGAIYDKRKQRVIISSLNQISPRSNTATASQSSTRSSTPFTSRTFG
jgi:hypothetical protein